MSGVVWVVGSTNVDLIARAERLPKPGETVLGDDFLQANGGKGANQAVAAARSGARVVFLTAVGIDAYGQACTAAFEAEGIDTSAVIRVDRPTGVALITVDRAGENAIVVAPGANGAVTGEAVRSAVDDLPAPAVCVCQLEVPIDGVRAALEAARSAGAVTVLDPAPARDLDDDLLGTVDCLTPNAAEAERLTGIAPDSTDAAVAAAESLRGRGVGCVVVTLGPRGVVVVDDHGADAVPAPAVRSVDSTAAGDTFAGYLAARLAEGADVRSALPEAICAGALSVTVAGAQPSIPFRAAVDEMVSTGFRNED